MRVESPDAKENEVYFSFLLKCQLVEKKNVSPLLYLAPLGRGHKNPWIFQGGGQNSAVGSIVRGAKTSAAS